MVALIVYIEWQCTTLSISPDSPKAALCRRNTSHPICSPNQPTTGLCMAKIFDLGFCIVGFWPAVTAAAAANNPCVNRRHCHRVVVVVFRHPGGERPVQLTWPDMRICARSSVCVYVCWVCVTSVCLCCTCRYLIPNHEHSLRHRTQNLIIDCTRSTPIDVTNTTTNIITTVTGSNGSNAMLFRGEGGINSVLRTCYRHIIAQNICRWFVNILITQTKCIHTQTENKCGSTCKYKRHRSVHQIQMHILVYLKLLWSINLLLIYDLVKKKIK